MFNFISNLFGGNKNKYFHYNPDTDELPADKQFGISLGQIIGEHNNYFVDSLEATKDVKLCRKIMNEWYGITDSLSAHEFLVSRSQEGHRLLYSEIIDIYLSNDGDISKLDKNDEDYEYIAEFFKKINDVLELDEGKKWFPNPHKDFMVRCNAWDVCRIVFVARTCYTLGYITESEAWNYIDTMKNMAVQSFTTWRNYAKSYLLGRMLWGGDDYDDFEYFAEITEFLVEDEDSPWHCLPSVFK